MTEQEFRKSVISEFRDKGYSKSVYQDFDELLAAITCLIKICIDRFTVEVSKLKAKHDIFAFIVKYNASNTSDQDTIAFKHLCKAIFTLIPKLRFSSTAKPLFPTIGVVDISQLMGIHQIMMELAQFYGIVITYQREVGRLFVSEDFWSFNFIDEIDYEVNCKFRQAVFAGALGSHQLGE